MRGCLSLVCFMFGACEALHSMIDIFRSKYHYYITLRYIITICSTMRHFLISTYLVLVTTTVTIIAILQCTARPALAVAKVASSRPVSRLITACFWLDIIKCAITPELWVRLVATSRVVGPSVAGCDLVHDLVEVLESWCRRRRRRRYHWCLLHRAASSWRHRRHDVEWIRTQRP